MPDKPENPEHPERRERLEQQPPKGALTGAFSFAPVL